MRLVRIFLVPVIFAALASCSENKTIIADMVILGGNIYTGISAESTAEAVVVVDDKIYFVGDSSDALKHVGERTQTIRLSSYSMYPGFIESHAHFMGIGQGKLNLDLSSVQSYDELIQMAAQAAANLKPGEWILGRGWHQSKWTGDTRDWVRGFPVHDALSKATPNNPVYFTHASGHAGLANAMAMKVSGVDAGTKDPEGGEIIRNKLSHPTGIFNETSQSLIRRNIPATTPEMQQRAFDLAQQNCLENGITGFHDAGVGQETIDFYEKMVSEDKLTLRLWVMLSGGDSLLLNSWFKRGPKMDTRGYLSIGAIKLYADGALGSRGAWLLEDYSDSDGHTGHATMPIGWIERISREGLQHGFQVCTHAIGDRANREVLNCYEKAFAAMPEKAKNARFRIEHAQHIALEDQKRFAEMKVIAAMQAIHMSSDRPWAIDRLGQQRIEEGAYVWRNLLDAGVKVINGSDAPVEDINPIAGFYASVTRKTLKGEPKDGYEANQKMNRFEALRSFTLDAAYGSFGEERQGSIEVGKFADFTVLSQDIMKIPENEILTTKVAMTIVGGKIVYRSVE